MKLVFQKFGEAVRQSTGYWSMLEGHCRASYMEILWAFTPSEKKLLSVRLLASCTTLTKQLRQSSWIEWRKQRIVWNFRKCSYLFFCHMRTCIPLSSATVSFAYFSVVYCISAQHRLYIFVLFMVKQSSLYITLLLTVFLVYRASLWFYRWLSVWLNFLQCYHSESCEKSDVSDKLSKPNLT